MKNKLHVFAIIFILGFFNTYAQNGNIMKVLDSNVLVGEDVVIEIEIINEDDFIAFTTDIPLPDDFTFKPGSAELDEDRRDDHSINTSVLEGNILRLLSVSLGQNFFTGNDGVILTFELETPTTPVSMNWNS